MVITSEIPKVSNQDHIQVVGRFNVGDIIKFSYFSLDHSLQQIESTAYSKIVDENVTLVKNKEVDAYEVVKKYVTELGQEITEDQVIELIKRSK